MKRIRIIDTAGVVRDSWNLHSRWPRDLYDGATAATAKARELFAVPGKKRWLELRVNPMLHRDEGRPVAFIGVPITADAAVQWLDVHLHEEA
jgi:hypothetical protein